MSAPKEEELMLLVHISLSNEIFIVYKYSGTFKGYNFSFQLYFF